GTAAAVPPAGADRRVLGARFPTVAVDGMEWDVNEVATALFEAGAEDLAVPVPTTDTLYAALRAAVRTVGPGGIAKEAPGFAGLPDDEFEEVRQCREFAYRLALSFWYRGARSRPMTAGEAAAALYLSDLWAYRPTDFSDPARRTPLVARALRQGAARVPLAALVRLGAALGAEMAGTGRERAQGRGWLYGQVLPDRHHRRFCFDFLRAQPQQPSALIVRPDAGGYVLGLIPPPGPGGIWRRPVRAEW
ncbi:hypothetical protein ACWF94_40605, partial [Streptomyces sp. NPDC055078]